VGTLDEFTDASSSIVFVMKNAADKMNLSIATFLNYVGIEIP